jgi:alkylhydroperoxidase family enzyme
MPDDDAMDLKRDRAVAPLAAGRPLRGPDGWAPAAAASYAAVAGACPPVDRSDPAVAAFADQFAVDVSGIGDDLRAGFLAATGASAFAVTLAVFVADFWPRVPSVLEAVLGPVDWPDPESLEVPDLWPLLDDFMKQVGRLDALDVTVTELIRLRGARQHDCRICKSRRSAAAIEAGADAVTFDAVDHYESSDLPAATKAALALTDAMIWTPAAVPEPVVAAVRRLLTPAETVEVVLDVARNAANKIAVALGADAATVTEGVELFVTDADGTLSVV